MPEGEFEFIARRLRPLATADAALGLADDAALLDPTPGRQLVLAKDAMVAGVRIPKDDPPAQIAQQLVRVNLSDLAAMGAAPLGYLLALARSRRSPTNGSASSAPGWPRTMPSSGSRCSAATRCRPRGRSPCRSPRRRGADGPRCCAAGRDPGMRSGSPGPSAMPRWASRCFKASGGHRRRARLADRALPAAAPAPRARPRAARDRERGDRRLGRSGRQPRSRPGGLRSRRRAAGRRVAALTRRP